MRLDQRRYGSAGNTERLSLNLGPVRVKAGVTDDVECALAGEPEIPVALTDVERRRIYEDLSARPSIHVHLLIWLARHLDIDQHRREGAGDRRRGDKNIVNHLQCLWVAAGGDFADVPDDRPSRVEIGGADQENPALGVLRGDCIEYRLIEVVGDGFPQGRVVGEGVLQGRRDVGPGFENIPAEIFV